jgi:hypothetical protein
MNAVAAVPRKPPSVTPHTVAVAVFALAFLAMFVYALFVGRSYYFLPLADRPLNDLHRDLRPAGPVGIGFGVLSTLLFAAIYVYPLRKRWAWLRNIGTTRHWLDFHIVMGLAAPALVALHSAFKFGGLAGMAYWIMLAVVASGLVGRYFYAQIPRSKKDAELSLAELHRMNAELSQDLRAQNIVPEEVWRPLVAPIRREEALRMPLAKSIARMLALDVARPFRLAALRRKALSGWDHARTLGGLLPSIHPDLERVVALVRRQSWLTAKVCFLDRAGQIFKMWHVVHLPFSATFVVLVVVHIGMAIWMGFFRVKLFLGDTWTH